MNSNISSDDGSLERAGKLDTVWFGLAGLFASAGLALSLYSLIHHLKVRSDGATDAACNINATVNCDAVALSAFAEPIFGIPLGIFGMGFFAALLVMLTLSKSSLKSSQDHLQAYGLFTYIGIASSIGLGMISWFQLGLVCLVCIGVYITCFLLAALTWWKRKVIFHPFSPGKALNGSWSGAIAVMAFVIAFQTYKSQFAQKPTSQTGSKEIPTLSKESQEIPLSLSAYSGLGEDFRKGADDAAVVIHEFADFQCPACQQASKTLGDLSKEYGRKILVVFRNYPLDMTCNSGISSKMHPFACQAAVLARCAGQYGKFWQAHDLIFEKQSEITDENLTSWATGPLGLKAEEWTTCKSSTDIVNKIKDDVALGNKLGVDATPTIFLNGKKVLGRRDYDTLRTLIDEQLRSR